MPHPFDFTVRTTHSYQTLLRSVALSTFCFIYATDYAIIDTTSTPANTSATLLYNTGFSMLNIGGDGLKFLSKTGPNYQITDTAVSFVSLVAADEIKIGYTNLTITPSQIQHPFMFTSTLDQARTFASKLDIGTGSEMVFELAGFNMGLSTTSSVVGAGTLSFNSSSGTPAVNSFSDLASFAGILKINNVTFNLQNTGAMTTSLRLSGAGALRKTGPGSLTLNGSHATFSGSVSLEGGSTVIGLGNALGTGPVTIKAPAILDVNAKALANSSLTLEGGTLSNTATSANSYSAALNVIANSAVTLGSSSSSNISVLGIVSGDKNITLTGSATGATLSFSHAANTYTGTVTINSAVGLSVRSTPIEGMGINLNHASSQLILSSGADPKTFHSVAGAGTVKMGPEMIVKNTSNQTFNGTLENSPSQISKFTKQGSGMLTLSKAGTFSGLARISEGVLKFAAHNVLGSGSLQIDSSGTVDLSGFNLNNSAINLSGGTLSNSGSAITLSRPIVLTASTTSTISGTGPLTLSAEINGAGSFTKAGSHELTITFPNNTYTGNTIVSAGQISVGATNALGNQGGLTIQSGASVDLKGYSINNSTISLSGGTLSNTGSAAVSLTGAVFAQTGTTSLISGSRDINLMGVLSGTGSITRSGNSKLVLSNTNTYSGSMTITEGKVVVEHSSALGTGSYTIESGSIDLNGYSVSGPSFILAGGGLQNGSSTLSSCSSPMTLSAHSGINAYSGDIILSGAITRTGSTQVLTKYGPNTLTLSALSTLSVPIAIDNGTLEIHGGSLLSPRKDINVAISATSSGNPSNLVLSNGWIDLRDADVTADAVTISAASPSSAIARVMVSEKFNPSGPITINGILETHISATTSPSGYILENTITGTGLIKKYGTGTLKLTGEIGGFTGAIQVYEGIVSSSDTLSGDLEVYAGSTLIADINNSAQRVSTLSGNLFGAVFTNDGVVHLGNNGTDLQILSYQNVLNRGNIYVNNFSYGHVRVNAIPSDASPALGQEFSTSGSGSNFWGAFFVPNGSLTFNGRFVKPATSTPGTWIYNSASASQSGQISLDPGSRYEGRLYSYSGGTLRFQSTNIDAPTYVEELATYFNGVIDVGLDKINATGSASAALSVDKLNMYNGSLILRPDVQLGKAAPNLLDSAVDPVLIEINTELQLPDDSMFSYYSFYNSAESAIRILPQGTPTSQSLSMNLLKLNGALNVPRNKDKILKLLKTSLLYDIENPSFDSQGVLSCTLRYKQPIQVLQSITSGSSTVALPDFYKKLAHSMLQQHNSTNNFSQYLYSTMIEGSSMLEHLRSFSPAGATPSALYQPIMNQHSQNLISLQRQNQNVIKLVSRLQNNTARQARGSQEHGLFQQLQAHQARQQKYAPMLAQQEQGGAASPRLESYRSLSLDGLSFESQLQYQHHYQPNRSPEEIGYKSIGWSTAVGVSYAKQEHYALGTTVSTAKIREKMNPNSLSKSGSKDDRLNSAALSGYYMLQSVPVTLSGSLSYGRHHYEQSRDWSQMNHQQNQQLELSASAQYKAWQTTAQAEIGYSYQHSPRAAVQPFIGATWDAVRTEGYREEAVLAGTAVASDYGYIVPEQQFKSHLYNVGIELIAVKKISGADALFFLRAGLSTQKKAGETTEFRYAFQYDPATEYQMEYQNYRDNTADITAGVYSSVHEGVTVTALYTGSFGPYLKNHSVSVSVDYAF